MGFNRVSVPNKNHEFISSTEVSAIFGLPHQSVCQRISQGIYEYMGEEKFFIARVENSNVQEILMTDDGLMMAVGFLAPHFGDSFLERYRQIFTRHLSCETREEAMEVMGDEITASQRVDALDRGNVVSELYSLLIEFSSREMQKN